MSPESTERKLAAILSADVVGYSRLMAEDEDETVRTLTAYREQVSLLVGEHRGRVVDFRGDDFLAEFPTARDAVTCAVEIQRVLRARNTGLPSARKLEFRIGIHLGDVRVEAERIYGDGVNIAARLEGLAEPGGICISGTVHEQVERKLDLAFEDLSEQSLKNIPKLVRVYRIRMQAEAAAAEETLPGMNELTVPGFSGRPAIAVLPFDNLSGDPEQEYFADGMAEDLITRLSMWREFPVIARNSSFIYKGTPVDVKRVSQELGVRYVVEGSVRKVGDRVRISAQLIDATTGHHIWAERYDRDLLAIFELQDQITESIVSTIEPQISEYEMERAIRRAPDRLNAWDLLQRGNWHLYRYTRADIDKARSLFRKAGEVDPSFGRPLAMVAVTYVSELVSGWAQSPAHHVEETIKSARESVARDDKDPACHVALCIAEAYARSGRAEAAFKVATRLNPSSLNAYQTMGDVLVASGRPEEAIDLYQKAMRLSPRDLFSWLVYDGMGMAHFAAGRYEAAAEWEERSIEHKSDWNRSYRILTASYAQLGRLDEARAALREFLRVNPEFSLQNYQRTFSAVPYYERLVEGLRKAGLKE